MKLKSSFLTTCLLIFTSMSFGLEKDIRSFESSVEEKVKEIALVQFGVTDAVVVSVQATLKKPKEKPIENKEIKSNDLDVGYLPLPVSQQVAKASAQPAAVEAVSETSWEDKIESLDIQLMVSSLVEKKAIQNLQANIQKVFKSYNPKVILQPVSVSLLKPRPKPPEEKKVEKPAEPQVVEAKKDELPLKEIINFGIILFSVLCIGVFFFLGMKSVSGAISSSFESLGQGLISLKQSGKTSMLDGSNKDGDSKKDGKAGDAVGTLGAGVKNQIELNIEKLKVFCQTEPIKVVSSLSMNEEDVVGLRWLLSQMNTAELDFFKNFLGQDTMQAIQAPSLAPLNFNITAWTQSLIEKITLLQLGGKAFVEEALSSEQIVVLYSLEEKNCFELARLNNDPVYWKIAMERISSEFFSAKSEMLNDENWQSILLCADINAQQIKQSIQKFLDDYKKQFVQENTSLQKDTKFERRILETLVASLNSLAPGKDDDFLEKIKHTKPDLFESLNKLYWPISRLQQVDRAQLRSFLNNLSNEALFSVLVCSAEKEQELIRQSLPDGLKKTVVLDLYNKAMSKKDANAYKAAIQVTKESMEKALELHNNGQLAFANSQPSKVQEVAS